MGRSHVRDSRSSGPKASGRISLIGRMPLTVSTSRSGPPFSHSSWRHRPHAMRVLRWFLLLVLLAVGVAAAWLSRWPDQPLPLSTPTVELSIEPGATPRLLPLQTEEVRRRK